VIYENLFVRLYMRKIKLIVGIGLVIFLLIGCLTKQVENEIERGVKAEPKEELKLNMPALYMGSTFGQYLRICKITGNYPQLLACTSMETRRKYNDSLLTDFFQNTQFSFALRLKAIKWNGEKFTMFYNTTIEATQKTIQINGVIENDSCKLILDFLNLDKPFVGM
jgi:hypothetical protein